MPRSAWPWSSRTRRRRPSSGSSPQQNQQIGYNIDGYTKLAATIDTASAGYANFAQKSTDAVRGGAAGAQQLSQQLSGQALAVAEEADTMQTRLTALSSGLGVSQKTIEQWASAAGISATKFAGAGENVGLLTTQIVGFVNKNAAAVTSTASLGTNIAIFGNDVFSATTQLDAFNGIWNTLVGNLLTKQEALTQAKTSFDNLKQTIAQTGSASDQSQQSFQAVHPAGRVGARARWKRAARRSARSTPTCRLRSTTSAPSGR